MDIRKDIIWNIVLSEIEPQVVYYIERPEYKFPSSNVKIKGKLHLESKGPVWNKIATELPLYMLPETEEWIKSKEPRTVYITASDSSGNLLERWVLHQAKCISCTKQKAKTLDAIVFHAVLDYERAIVN